MVKFIVLFPNVSDSIRLTPLSKDNIAFAKLFFIILLSYRTYYFCWFLNMTSISGMFIYLLLFSYLFFCFDRSNLKPDFSILLSGIF